MPALEVLLFHAAITAAEVAVGLVAGVLAGLASGFALARAPHARRLASPIMTLLHVAPVVMLAPLLAMWLGSGIYPKILFAAVLVAMTVSLGVLRRDPVAGLRAAPGIAVTGVSIAELVGATKGLGYLVAFGQSQNNGLLVIAATALLTLIGLAAYGLVVYVERCLVRRPRPRSDLDYLGA
jgi:ABC-type nitrate/sulfonate/bicarbonate transport system permease component